MYRIHVAYRDRDDFAYPSHESTVLNDMVVVLRRCLPASFEEIVKRTSVLEYNLDLPGQEPMRVFLFADTLPEYLSLISLLRLMCLARKLLQDKDGSEYGKNHLTLTKLVEDSASMDAETELRTLVMRMLVASPVDVHTAQELTTDQLLTILDMAITHRDRPHEALRVLANVA